MITPDFTGYGARLEVRFIEKQTPEEIINKIKSFMSRLSLDCIEAGVKLIGHIKSVTEIPGDGYLGCSVTNHNGVVETSGAIDGYTDYFEMILNVMIYGLEMGKVKEIVEERVKDDFSNGCTYSLEVLEITEGETEHAHDHHNHEHIIHLDDF